MVLLSSLGLISLALLLLGTYGKAMEHNSAHYDRKSLGIAGDTQRTTKAGLHAGLAIGAIDRIAAVGLPIWTACELGGSRLAVLLLVLAASGLMPVNYAPGERSTSRNWEKPGTSRKAIPAWLCLSLFSSAYFAGALRQVVGSSALLIWLLAAKSPYQVSMHSPDSAISPPPSAKSTSAVLALPTEQTPETTRIDLWKASPLIRTAHDTHLTLLSGVLLATVTVVLAALTCGRNFSVVSATKFLSCALLIDLSILFCQPFRLQTKGKFGCLLGIVVSMSVSVVSRQSWLSMSIESVLSLLGYFAAQYDDGVFRHAKPSVHKHMHAHKSHLPEKPNVLTKFLMREFRTWPLLHEILQDGNSRRIFYFMSINFAFMFIQMVYGYLTGSLGLISDSIHMLFDCVALLVGLCAVVLSNWPPSDQYPYGYGKLDQLAGLGNGVFLLLVTVEIFYGAFERLAENRSLERVNDLLIVSVLGLLVNIYGMLAFDHGHDHSHGHHDHHHDSDNMRGIYLHILGDALGSVGVVISTILVRYTGWNGWDPIASCIIAIIIGLHALPLVKRTAQSLLMALPDDAEYSLRNTLAGVSSLRGVVGYTTPKFWLAPGLENEHDSHQHHGDHDHGHDHDHAHSSHDHHHGHPHSHSHNHSHDHEESVDHGHDCDEGHPRSHPSSPKRSRTAEKAHVLGIIHIVVSRTADLEQVRRQVTTYFLERKMDIAVQVEREGDGRCWCGGGPKSV